MDHITYRMTHRVMDGDVGYGTQSLEKNLNLFDEEKGRSEVNL